MRIFVILSEKKQKNWNNKYLPLSNIIKYTVVQPHHNLLKISAFVPWTFFESINLLHLIVFVSGWLYNVKTVIVIYVFYHRVWHENISGDSDVNRITAFPWNSCTSFKTTDSLCQITQTTETLLSKHAIYFLYFRNQTI